MPQFTVDDGTIEMRITGCSRMIYKLFVDGVDTRQFISIPNTRESSDSLVASLNRYLHVFSYAIHHSAGGPSIAITTRVAKGDKHITKTFAPPPQPTTTTTAPKDIVQPPVKDTQTLESFEVAIESIGQAVNQLDDDISCVFVLMPTAVLPRQTSCDGEFFMRNSFLVANKLKKAGVLRDLSKLFRPKTTHNTLSIEEHDGVYVITNNDMKTITLPAKTPFELRDIDGTMCAIIWWSKYFE